MKIIYHLSQITKNTGKVNTLDIAKALDVKPSSVTSMLVKLSEKGWLKYEKYQGVELTESGNNRALEIIRKHRLWEYFLHHVLSIERENVHHIAEQLEHIQSEELIKALDKYLGFPQFDPHGEPIPDSNLKWPEDQHVPLVDWPKNKLFQIAGIRNPQKEIQHYFEMVGVQQGKIGKIIHQIQDEGTLIVEINGSKTMITKNMAHNILVKDID